MLSNKTLKQLAPKRSPDDSCETEGLGANTKPRRYHHLAIKGTILTSLLTLSTACGNGAAIENLVSPDPALKKAQTEEVSDRTRLQASRDTPSNTESALSAVDEGGNVDTNNLSPGEATEERETAARQRSEDPSSLLLNFPAAFPVYPQAELQETRSGENENSGMLIWNTADRRQAVADYYQAELTANDWEIIKPFTFNSQSKIARAIAIKEDLRVELSLVSAMQNQENTGQTRLSVVYHPLEQDIPQSSIAKSNSLDAPETNRNAASDRPSVENPPSKNAPTPNGSDSATVPQSRKNPQSSNKANEPILEGKSYSLVDTDFTDLDEVPSQLQQPIESVAALNVLTPYTGEANVELTKFAPNEIITRGEYARWLIAANNRYYTDNPGKKIYVASKQSQPAFNDVNPKHPDFAAIQSLAEAGLIPSLLTEDSTNLLFRPDAPLIREDLVTWKVPLDTRKSLPQASIEAIKESWGFQDAAKIDSSAVRALYADFQNGDRANIRRIFGYTTLFQPKKPVTRAEAAASLWYFGFQGDGVTAKEILESEVETQS